MKKLLPTVLCLILIVSIIITVVSSFEPVKDVPPSDGQDTSTQGQSSQAVKYPYVPTKKNKKEVISEEGFYLSGSGNYVKRETVDKYPQITNLPTLYINIDGGEESIQRDVYSQATYSFASDHVIDSYYEKNMEIKGRGNWSWGFAQKPYTIKLAEEADLCGMGDAKTWVLISVHSDKTMMHNFMTQKLAKNMGLEGSCDNEYIDVVCNGEYIGTYVLTEKIQFHENRIDMEEDSGMLFEIEMVYRHTCEGNCLILHENASNPGNSIHMRLIEYGDCDLDNLTKEQTAQLKTDMKNAQEQIDNISRAMQGNYYDYLKTVIDVESFVNWYLLNELTRNYDSAFVTSCFCYFNSEGLLCMGPVWDFDTCYGIQDPNYDSSRIQDGPWFDWLINNCPDFKREVCLRWSELRLDGTLDDFYGAIDKVETHIKASEILQHTRYPDSELLNVPFDEAVIYFKTWLVNRVLWMDENFFIIDGIYDKEFQ